MSVQNPEIPRNEHIPSECAAAAIYLVVVGPGEPPAQAAGHKDASDLVRPLGPDKKGTVRERAYLGGPLSGRPTRRPPHWSGRVVVSGPVQADLTHPSLVLFVRGRATAARGNFVGTLGTIGSGRTFCLMVPDYRTVPDYRHLQLICERQALATSNEETRKAFGEIAEEYRKMAEFLEHKLQEQQRH